MSDREHIHTDISDDRPLAGGQKGGPAHAGIGGPADFAPETGGPDFSRGGHKAGSPAPGAHIRGDRDLTPDEHLEHGSAEPERR